MRGDLFLISFQVLHNIVKTSVPSQYQFCQQLYMYHIYFRSLIVIFLIPQTSYTSKPKIQGVKVGTMGLGMLWHFAS